MRAFVHKINVIHGLITVKMIPIDRLDSGIRYIIIPDARYFVVPVPRPAA